MCLVEIFLSLHSSTNQAAEFYPVKLPGYSSEVMWEWMAPTQQAEETGTALWTSSHQIAKFFIWLLWYTCTSEQNCVFSLHTYEQIQLWRDNSMVVLDKIRSDIFDLWFLPSSQLYNSCQHYIGGKPGSPPPHVSDSFYHKRAERKQLKMDLKSQQTHGWDTLGSFHWASPLND